MMIRGYYGESEQGNFKVVDTIEIPHPYVIGSRHVSHAADHFSGSLGPESIEDAERKGVHCAQRGCKFTYAEHETALLVKCKMAITDDSGKAELHAYLLKIKDEATKNGYAGFAFIR